MISFHDVVKKNEETILSGWMEEMGKSIRRIDLMGDAEFKRQAKELLGLFMKATQRGSDADSEDFAPIREFLKDIAKTRMDQGLLRPIRRSLCSRSRSLSSTRCGTLSKPILPTW